MKLTIADRAIMSAENLCRILYRLLWKLFHLRLYKNPKQYVPLNTFYCYNFNGKNGMRLQKADGKRIMLPYYGADYCVFHNSLWNMDLCMLDGGDCMMDSCKTCGINEGLDDDS